MNPAEMPLTVETLTVLEEQYRFAVRRQGKKALTEPALVYRLARELKHYKLQEAVGRADVPKTWTAEVKRK